MDTFDMQDKIFSLFSTDTAMKTALGITADYLATFGGDDEYNLQCALDIKIKRQELSLDQVVVENLPYMTTAFINAHVTRNYLVNHGVLEIITYGSWIDAKSIVKIQKKILQDNFEDYQVTREGQVSSGVSGIYAYSVRYNPIVKA